MPEKSLQKQSENITLTASRHNNGYVNVFQWNNIRIFSHICSPTRFLNQDSNTSCSRQQLIQFPQHIYLFGRTGFKTQDILKENEYILTNLQVVRIKNFLSPKVCHKHLFLQYAGVWYFKSHTYNVAENLYDCVIETVQPLSEDESLIANTGYLDGWVHNTYSFFTAIFLFQL